MARTLYWSFLIMSKDFSLDNFKKWMETQCNDSDINNIEGQEVYAKISKRKLMEKIDVEDGDDEEVSNDFLKNGGTVVESDGRLLLIQVESGNFYLEQKYIKI